MMFEVLLLEDVRFLSGRSRGGRPLETSSRIHVLTRTRNISSHCRRRPVSLSMSLSARDVGKTAMTSSRQYWNDTGAVELARPLDCKADTHQSMTGDSMAPACQDDTHKSVGTFSAFWLRSVYHLRSSLSFVVHHHTGHRGSRRKTSSWHPRRLVCLK